MTSIDHEILLRSLYDLQGVSDGWQASIIQDTPPPDFAERVARIARLEDVISRLSDVLGIPHSSPDPEPTTEGTDDT